MKKVTERDLRAKEFQNGEPEDYEFREDGKIVRKDRWEKGIRSIACSLGWARKEFEIDDLVSEVRKLIEKRQDEHILYTDEDEYKPEEILDSNEQTKL